MLSNYPHNGLILRKRRNNDATIHVRRAVAKVDDQLGIFGDADIGEVSKIDFRLGAGAEIRRNVVGRSIWRPTQPAAAVLAHLGIETDPALAQVFEVNLRPRRHDPAWPF